MALVRCIALLACGAAGVGLAVWLAASTGPEPAPAAPLARTEPFSAGATLPDTKPADGAAQAAPAAPNVELAVALVETAPPEPRAAVKHKRRNPRSARAGRSKAPLDEPQLVQPRSALAMQAPSVSGDPTRQIDPSQFDPETIRRMEPLVRSMLGLPPGNAPAAGGFNGAGQTPPAPSPALPAMNPGLPEPPRAADPAPLRHPKHEITRSSGDGDHGLTIHIQDTDLREVLDMISEQGGLNILASNNVQGKVSAALTNVDLDTALAAILKSTGFVARRDGQFIYVGTPADFQNMQQSLDVVGTRIYRLNYIKASELQQLVTPLLTQGIGTLSVTVPSQVGIAANTPDGGGDTFAGNEAVLVRDFEAVLTQIDQVVAEMDKRPMQVAIEAMLISVQLNDSFAFGVDWELLRNKANVRLAEGSPLTDLGQMNFTNGGLKFGFLDSSLGTFVQALETIGDTNVLATPRVMCINKHKAEILIGSQKGYLNATVTNLTSTQQNVAFLEVGTNLRLRPFISSDGMIRMEIHPESSTGDVRVEGGFTLPDKDVTQVTTNIMVRDGCTVVIGGLLREELGTNMNRIPLLGSLPGVGWLFRFKKDTIIRRELVILITPHIVYDQSAGIEGDKAACEFHRRQAVYADHMSPWGSRYLGRRYFRMAQNSWAGCDKASATRYVEMAINFDPTNRAAIDLQADICAGIHSGDHSGGNGAEPPPAALPGSAAADPAHSPWVLDELQGAGQAPLHPIDPGQPGRSRNIERPGRLH